MSALYRFLDEGETIEAGDVAGFRVPVAAEFLGLPVQHGWVVLRPVNGYVVDLDGVEPADVYENPIGKFTLITSPTSAWEVDQAEQFALRILAAVAKVRAL